VPDSAQNSGVLTFLFTDIEGSTRRWEADAGAMRTALAAHDRVLGEAITGHCGRLFKHTGDGVCAVFPSPRAAVDAAISAQQALELPVRMGIATGEAEAQGDDYFGSVLNRAARVMAAGHGGQILVEGVTAGLVSGVELVPLGAQRLRDLAQPVDIFQIRATGLGTQFPPLVTLTATPGNLRPQTTTFIGRDAELTELAAALHMHRLVTLTGVGGVGKTRLALEAAGGLTNRFPDGIWLIELAAVGDPAAVPEATAAALGILQQPAMSLADSVAAALEGRSRLLVFDNCEHVLDAAADLIEKILARSDTVTILTTSREGLRVADEQLWPVPSLEVKTGAESAAAMLFADRAQAVAPAFSLSDATESAAVAEICNRLDGIPLAIELAASRILSMTATEVRDRLDDRFRLLVGSRRSLERHQTLRHAVGWSYDLLDDPEKALLNRCAAFAGGFDLGAACAVAGSGDEFATLDLLDALVRKSLLAADKTSGRTRFSMLETIRQFAEEQLAASGAADAARTAHARYFAGRITDLLARWDGPRQREVYRWFTVELANLRTAFRWAADTDDLDAAAPIAVYATFLGYFVEQWEPIAWIEELIGPAKAANHPLLAQLYALAGYCAALGRVEEFLGYAESCRTAMDSGRFDEVSDNLACACAAGFTTIGRPEDAVEWCRAVIARDPGPHTASLAVMVVALHVAGAEDEAIRESETLLAAARDTDNPCLAAAALLGYGWARRDTDPSTAYESLRRGWNIAEDSGNRQTASITAVLLSRLAAARGEFADALDYIAQAIQRYYDSGSLSFLYSAMGILAALLDQLEDYEQAATISGFATTAIALAAFPELHVTIVHLRDELGDGTYESLARGGQTMTTAAMVTYALDQIHRVRAALD
jgi:predicted ATPase/class 3 adenylate cyclase